MDNYTGKIYFYKNIKYSYVNVSMEGDTYFENSVDHVLVGESEVVSVDMVVDTRAAEIELIETEVKKKSIEHQVWLDTMSGKIQSLRAIEAPQ